MSQSPRRTASFLRSILLQYAGVYALNAHAVAARAAEGWLVINVDSHDKLPSDPSGNVPRNYQAVGNTDRETSYFLNMYLRDSRALDYLMTRPDWDGKTIVLMGTSMGGQQSMVLAGLRPEKITAVLVCVPAGADANGDLHGRKAGYPNWPSNDPKVMNTALYFDPVNFASRIKAPVLAAIGFIDTTSPPAGIWTELNQIPGPERAAADDRIGAQQSHAAERTELGCAFEGTAGNSVERRGVQAERNEVTGLDRKAASVTWSAAFTLLLLAGVYMIRGTLVLFAIALLLAYLLHPLVSQVSRQFTHGTERWRWASHM